MANLTELCEEIREMQGLGYSFKQIEEYLKEMKLSDESYSALWLYAWSRASYESRIRLLWHS